MNAALSKQQAIIALSVPFEKLVLSSFILCQWFHRKLNQENGEKTNFYPTTVYRTTSLEKEILNSKSTSTVPCNYEFPVELASSAIF